MPDLIQIPKPELGRPNDSRLTQAYLDARPELKGLTPFNPATDFDLVDMINDRLGQLHALVQYADADLYGAVTAARDSAVQAAQDAQDNIAAVNAEWADTKSDIAEAQQVADQQIATAQALAATFGASGLVYQGLDVSGAVQLGVFAPATITTATEAVPLVGNITVPTLTIGGPA